ncbi:hypothetical protein E2320_007116, partial [Naja naja]
LGGVLELTKEKEKEEGGKEEEEKEGRLELVKEKEEEEEEERKIIFTWIKRDSKALWKTKTYNIVHATPSIEKEGDSLHPVVDFKVYLFRL